MVRNPKKEKPSGNRPFTMISEAEMFENELKSKLQSRMIDTEEYDDWYENIVEYHISLNTFLPWIVVSAAKIQFNK